MHLASKLNSFQKTQFICKSLVTGGGAQQALQTGPTFVEEVSGYIRDYDSEQVAHIPSVAVNMWSVDGYISNQVQSDAATGLWTFSTYDPKGTKYVVGMHKNTVMMGNGSCLVTFGEPASKNNIDICVNKMGVLPWFYPANPDKYLPNGNQIRISDCDEYGAAALGEEFGTTTYVRQYAPDAYLVGGFDYQDDAIAMFEQWRQLHMNSGSVTSPGPEHIMFANLQYEDADAICTAINNRLGGHVIVGIY